MIEYDNETAILFIIFKRANTTRKVLEQIRSVRPRRLYISADGPKDDIESIECEKTRKILSTIDWKCQVFKLYQNENLGCDTHCYQAISWFFERETEGIILEDDCVPSLSFFGFCSTLLKKYRNDERIGHIAGSNYQFGKVRGLGSYYFSNLTHIGGWAGWRRVWKTQRLDDNKYNIFEQLDYLSYLPSHAPFYSYWNLFYDLSNRNKDVGWDFRYAYTNLVNNRLSIIPNHNLISNIGYFDNATHYVEDHPFAALDCSEIKEIIHPDFILPDIEADLYSQSMEYDIPIDSIYQPRDYAFLRTQLKTITQIGNDCFKIPKVIHQIYEDLEGVPSYLKKISQSWQEMNPDWEYKFWNKKDIELFMNEYYPEYIEKYNAFSYNVQRWDVIRYLILYKIGGLYVDMDYECTENITPVLYNLECAMGLEPNSHLVRRKIPYIVGNAFMASIPRHSYFRELIDEVFKDRATPLIYDYPQELVVDTTGPYMTTRVYTRIKDKLNVTLIPAELIAPLDQKEVRKLMEQKRSKNIIDKIERSFAIHYYFGSWINQL